MRVLTISNLFPPVVVGGAELYAGWISDHLRTNGHTVATVTLGVDDAEGLVAAIAPFPYRPEVAREQSPPKRVLFHAADIWRPDVTKAVAAAIDEFKPDVVHTHTVQGMSIAAMVAARNSPAAHVHTLHDYWLLCWRTTLARRGGGECGPACVVLRKARGKILERRPPDVVLSPSHAVFTEHRTRGIDFAGIDTEVIPHPVEDVRAHPPRTPGAPPTFGYLGQVNPNKGIATMVEAFRRLDIDGARLLVAGRGRAIEHVTGRESEGIHYLGWVGPDEKERFFDDIDALVVASEWPEPAGLVINEAKGRGLPVIGTTSGGIPEYVPVNSRALAVPPSDPDALAASMRLLAEDPTPYLPIPSDVAVDWPVHTARVEAAYERAIAGRARR